MRPVGLTLGAVLFNWPAERLRAFYEDIAAAPVFDRVHLGEVVCSKRMPFSDPVWPDVIDMLEASGKEVVLSTLALPTLPRERRALAQWAGLERLVEINDLAAMPACAGRPFVVGPFVNVYNEAAAALLAESGAVSICLPVEVPLQAARTIAAAVPGTDIEIFAFGRLPLALSGRCYHARIHGLHKDACQFVCERDPDGLDVETIEGRPFLAANGIQTLSHSVQAFLPTEEECAASGISRLRLSPHTLDMNEVGRIMRERLAGAMDRARAQALLAALGLPGPLVDGFLHGRAGCAQIVA